MPGRTPVLGEGGVLLQGPSGLVSANGAYIQNPGPNQFGQGSNIAIANGEEGNSNLMWLLDFKLDFFNDSEAGKNYFKLLSFIKRLSIYDLERKTITINTIQNKFNVFL